MKPAHVHLISAVLAELQGLPDGPAPRRLRLLDVGCGYGGLISDLLQVFTSIPDLELEVYGFEVSDHRGSTPGYFERVAEQLGSRWPGVDWGDRIRLGEGSSQWPFPSGFFDLAVSNQVVEHVENLELFFGETRRVLRPGGRSIHFYPSRAVLVEPHCGVPGAHWIEDGRGRRRWLAWLSAAGFGKYRRYRQDLGCALPEFCEEFSDYLRRYVYFRSNREIRALGRLHSQRCGFKYDGALARRALSDDWEPYAYRLAPVFRSRSLVSPFACSTLVQSM